MVFPEEKTMAPRVLLPFWTSVHFHPIPYHPHLQAEHGDQGGIPQGNEGGGVEGQGEES